MIYDNILNVNNFSKKEISLKISKIGNFSWHPLLIEDKQMSNFDKIINCYIETPLSLINSCEKSIYNNQFYLSLDIPNFKNREDKEFYCVIDNINKQILSSIKKAIVSNNQKNNKNYIFENFWNPFSLENKKNIRLHIDDKIVLSLFYDSNYNTISKEIYNSPNFMKDMKNRKLKCIFKPMVWVKLHNNKVISGVKYYICQCILSDTKNINEKEIINKKLLSFDEDNCVCPICHSCIDSNESGNYNTAITELSCKHRFHFKCINTWWSTQSSNNRNLSCPVCRNL